MKVINDLVKRHPDLGSETDEKINQKLTDREYQALMDAGQKAYNADPQRLYDAYDAFRGAKGLKDTPEVKKSLAAVDKRRRLPKYWTAAEKAFDEGNYAEAAK